MPMTASVTVHVDKDGAMAITQNPTLAPAVQKSKHEPKAQETDVRVSSDTVKDLSLIHIYWDGSADSRGNMALRRHREDGHIRNV